jgi:hypothetical protein
MHDPCPEIVYEASSDLICDKSLTSAKKNHHGNGGRQRQSIHTAYERAIVEVRQQ